MRAMARAEGEKASTLVAIVKAIAIVKIDLVMVNSIVDQYYGRRRRTRLWMSREQRKGKVEASTEIHHVHDFFKKSRRANIL